MCGVGSDIELLLEEDKGQYKLEDFGEVVAWNKDGTPFMVYRDNKKKDIEQEQLSFEDTVRQLTKQYSNNMELGGKIRELCDE
jgi:hypothetical protein